MVHPISLIIEKSTAKELMRITWDKVHILKLEIEKYKTKYPEYLQDKVYLTQCQNQLNTWLQLHNSCDTAIHEDQQMFDNVGNNSTKS